MRHGWSWLPKTLVTISDASLFNITHLYFHSFTQVLKIFT